MRTLYYKFTALDYKAAIAILVAIAVIGILVFVFLSLISPIERGDTSRMEINIEKGDSLNVIAAKLDSAGVIRSKFLFVAYSRIVGQSNYLQAGRYIFSKSLNIPTIISFIVTGKSEPTDSRVLIPEGYNIWEIDERLVYLKLIKEGGFAARYFEDEGYLFPDSYRLKERGTADLASELVTEELREKMRINFNEKTASLLGGLSLAEVRETITIASILEKEARAEKDMKLVSGIIRNRIKLGMLLQVDATVIYGACMRKSIQNNFSRNCDVTFQGPAIEIKIDGPYNTYTRKGLPPGPIANPGLQAIEAALNPTDSDYLYYLSTRDGSQMIYSKTAGEHVANRRKYLGI